MVQSDFPTSAELDTVMLEFQQQRKDIRDILVEAKQNPAQGARLLSEALDRIIDSFGRELSERRYDPCNMGHGYEESDQGRKTETYGLAVFFLKWVLVRCCSNHVSGLMHNLGTGRSADEDWLVGFEWAFSNCDAAMADAMVADGHYPGLKQWGLARLTAIVNAHLPVRKDRALEKAIAAMKEELDASGVQFFDHLVAEVAIQRAEGEQRRKEGKKPEPFLRSGLIQPKAGKMSAGRVSGRTLVSRVAAAVKEAQVPGNDREDSLDTAAAELILDRRPSPEDAVLLREEVNAARSRLDSLPRAQQEDFRRVHEEQATYEEAAAARGVTREAVRRNLKKANKKLRSAEAADQG